VKSALTGGGDLGTVNQGERALLRGCLLWRATRSRKRSDETGDKSQEKRVGNPHSRTPTKGRAHRRTSLGVAKDSVCDVPGRRPEGDLIPLWKPTDGFKNEREGNTPLKVTGNGPRDQKE